MMVIIVWDLFYWQCLDFLFLYEDCKLLFVGNEIYVYDIVYCNFILQGVYFMIVVCVLGLDVGVMLGFFNEIVDQEFFSENGWKLNFFCNFGYVDEIVLF